MTDVELIVSDDPTAELGATLGGWGLVGETIVLTGGSTIGRAYERAAESADWSASAVWWGDERCVPPDDERSNYGLAKRTLLDRLEEQPEVHRIRGELDPAEAAAEYEREIAGPPDRASCCSASAPTVTSPRSSRARRSSRSGRAS